jgi:hypothetical protein
MLIRLIGVKLGGLIGGVQQLDLFDNNDKMIKLYLSMDKIRLRYGSDAIHRASGVEKTIKSPSPNLSPKRERSLVPINAEYNPEG